MSRQRGEMLTKLLRRSASLLMLCLPLTLHAIEVGNMTFSMASGDEFSSKRVMNNNKSARLYRVSIVAIDRPGSQEVRLRPADGELLFAPRQLTLQAGESDYFKFYYHGIKDNRERYYRVSFREIPTRNYVMRNADGRGFSLAPVVVMDTILVVRPRQAKFAWDFDRTAGIVSNTGNTWFKLLIKPGCDSTEEMAETWYLRPGDVVHEASLRQTGNHLIIYNNKYIKISDNCTG